MEAIVNAANATLLGGGGVDGAIHRAAHVASLARAHGLRTIAFPAISCGAYGVPIHEAAAVAAARSAEDLDEVRFVLFDERTWRARDRALKA